MHLSMSQHMFTSKHFTIVWSSPLYHFPSVEFAKRMAPECGRCSTALTHVCESWRSQALSTHSHLWVHRNELHISQVRCRDSSCIANLMLENLKHWRLYLWFLQDFGSADTGAAREDEYESKLSETEFGFHHEISSAWVVVKCYFGGHNNKAQKYTSAGKYASCNHCIPRTKQCKFAN